MFKKIFSAFIQEPKGEPIDMGPGLRIAREVQPPVRLSFNEVFQNVARELHPTVKTSAQTGVNN